jgi:hypothetical protein
MGAEAERYLGMGHGYSTAAPAEAKARHQQLVNGLGAILRD